MYVCMKLPYYDRTNAIPWGEETEYYDFDFESLTIHTHNHRPYICAYTLGMTPQTLSKEEN